MARPELHQAVLDHILSGLKRVVPVKTGNDLKVLRKAGK